MECQSEVQGLRQCFGLVVILRLPHSSEYGILLLIHVVDSMDPVHVSWISKVVYVLIGMDLISRLYLPVVRLGGRHDVAGLGHWVVNLYI